MSLRSVLASSLATAMVAATAAGCGWSGLNENPLPFARGQGDDCHNHTLHLANAVNLVPNSEVKVNDVTVGSVRRIEFDDWHARLTVGLEPGVRLPANAEARIGQKSLLGAEYLELAPPTGDEPRGTLADGDVIPLSRTGRYPETEELFAALATVLNGGGLAQIDTITSELNDAFGGREVDVRRLVKQLGTLIGTLDDQRAAIVTATEGVNELSETFADDRATLSRALDTFPRAVDVLRDEREQLTRTLDRLSEFGESTTDLMTANRVRLRRNLANLRPILHELGDAGDALTNFMSAITFPFPLEGLIKSAKGDYLNLFLTVDLTTTAITRDLLGGISPLDALYSGLTGTPPSATASSTSDPLDLKGSLDKLAKVQDKPAPAPSPPAPPVPGAAPKPGLGGLLEGLTRGLL